MYLDSKTPKAKRMKLKNSILIGALLLSGSAFSQIKAVEDADNLFYAGEYKSSLKMYEDFEKQLKHKDYNWYYKIAEAKYRLKDYAGSAEAYAIILDHKGMPIDMFLHYAHVLRYLNRHEEAKPMYQKFFELHGKHDVTNYVKGCELAIMKNLEPSKFEVVPTNLSLPGLYFGSAAYKEGLVYSVPVEVFDKKNNIYYPNYKLVYSKIEKGDFASTEDFTAVSTKFYIGSPDFSNDKNTLFFNMTESDMKFSHHKKFEKHGIAHHGHNTLNIYESDYNGSAWSEPQPVAFNSKDHNTIHPCISPDGKRMYFACDKPGGKGGYDIYYSSKTGDVWSAPVTIGDLANSQDNEMFPYIYNDTTLYFASDGHVGYGGADIFVSYYRNGQWQAPENMGRTFNSEKDDFGIFFIAPREGYFASNRNTEPGKDELLYFSRKIVLKMGKGEVTDKLYSKRIEGAEVDLYENDVFVTSLYSDRKGDYKYDKFDLEKKYSLHVKKDGYREKEMDVDPLTADLDKLDFQLQPVLTKNTILTFNDILFEYGKADVQGDSRAILKKVTDLLMENPGAKVELSAHTDSRGSDKVNLELSQKRAQACVDILIAGGVDPANLVAKGYGESKLKNDCGNKSKCSEEDHAINRRVEIKVLDVKVKE
jgi:outer membrane protein OmpA-like peptidoglycan-associated protein